MSGTFPPQVVTAACAAQARWDILASISLAQWALESAWGSAMPAGSNNPFGIKASARQPSVAAATHEVVAGRSVAVTARFRVFESLTEAFDAHAELLATAAPYAKARLVRHDPEAFAAALTGVYATDPHYGDKLLALMRAHDLQHYDAPAAARPAALPAPTSLAHPGPAPMTWFERLMVALTFGKAV